MFWRKRDIYFDEHRWDKLATYNAEVSRGIVHTEEWKALMAKEQETFNEFQYGPNWRRKFGLAESGKNEGAK